MGRSAVHKKEKTQKRFTVQTGVQKSNKINLDKNLKVGGEGKSIKTGWTGK